MEVIKSIIIPTLYINAVFILGCFIEWDISIYNHMINNSAIIRSMVVICLLASLGTYFVRKELRRNKSKNNRRIE